MTAVASASDAAMIAIENSIEGGVTAAQDALAATPGIRIISEHVVNVNFSLVAPAGTPPEVTQRLGREIATALRQPTLQAQLAAGGYEPVGSTPEALQAHIEREITRWATVVKSTGAKVD